MSLFAPGVSLVTSAASAAVAVSPKASAAAVVKSVSFDLIEVSFREVFEGSRRTKAYLSPGSAGTDRERVDWSGVPTGALRTHLSPGQAHGFLITLPAGDGLRRRGGSLRALLRVTGRRCKYVAVAR